MIRTLATGIVLLAAATAVPTAAVAQQPPQRGDSSQSGGRPDHRMGPPPEAFEVCEGADTDDACAVNTPDGTLEGQCRPDRQDASTLVCVPERPPGGQGHGRGGQNCDSEHAHRGTRGSDSNL
jgi:hypothetical protein